MARNIELCQYLPEIVKQNREFQMLCQSETPEINKMWQAIEVVFQNSFLESLTEYGCNRWENILQMIPAKTDTLQIRRKNIWIRLNENLPYTWRRLKEIMNGLCGENGYTMELKHLEYFIEMKLFLNQHNGEENSHKLVADMLKRVLPANIGYHMGLQYCGEDSIVSVGAMPILSVKMEVMPQMVKSYLENITVLTGGQVLIGIRMFIA